jgi:hypothetical protein
MKKIIFFIPVLVLISILVSCSSDKEKKVEAEKQLKVEKEILIGNLISKYDIQYKWDTLGYKYSIEYEPVLSSKYQLIDKFTISDIFKKDSSMYIQIRVAYYPTFFFLLSINSDQLDKILTNTIPGSTSSPTCIITNPS